MDPRRTQALSSVSGDAVLARARTTETAATTPAERSELTFALVREVEARTVALDNRVIGVEQAVKALDTEATRWLSKLEWVMLVGMVVMLMAFAGGAAWVRAQFVHQISAITEQNQAINAQHATVRALRSEFDAFKARVKNVCRGGREDPTTGNWVETCELVIEPVSCPSAPSSGPAP